MGLFSGLVGNTNYNKNIKDLKAAKREAQDVLRRRANEDYLSTAEAQGVLAQMRDQLRERYKSAEASAAVTGATDEAVALQKAAGNNAVGEVTAQLAAKGTARHDNAMDDYLNATKAYNEAIAGQRAAKAQATSAAMGKLIDAGTSLATAGASGAFKKGGA